VTSAEAATGTYPQGRFLLPPDAVELVLVRHGQSQPYVDGTAFPLTGGHGDPPLSPQGYRQARQVGSRLAAGRIDAIYVTTLCRTTQTATPLAELRGLELQVEADLREVHLGDWEGGLFRKMVAEGHPTALQMFAQERWDVIPGAEPAGAFAGRVRSAILRLAASHQGERVAVFTHGGVIGQVLALATGSRPFAFTRADNASISRLVVTGDQWMLRGFNDTSHLDEPA
jgi:probable phosphoglycerate mutase